MGALCQKMYDVVKTFKPFSENEQHIHQMSIRSKYFSTTYIKAHALLCKALTEGKQQQEQQQHNLYF